MERLKCLAGLMHQNVFKDFEHNQNDEKLFISHSRFSWCNPKSFMSHSMRVPLKANILEKDPGIYCFEQLINEPGGLSKMAHYMCLSKATQKNLNIVLTQARLVINNFVQKFNDELYHALEKNDSRLVENILLPRFQMITRNGWLTVEHARQHPLTSTQVVEFLKIAQLKHLENSETLEEFKNFQRQCVINLRQALNAQQTIHQTLSNPTNECILNLSVHFVLSIFASTLPVTLACMNTFENTLFHHLVNPNLSNVQKTMRSFVNNMAISIPFSFLYTLFFLWLFVHVKNVQTHRLADEYMFGFKPKPIHNTYH